MIEYVNADITTVTSGLVVHGTNCSGGFGSGVAGAIRRAWPIVYKTFCQYPPGSHLLGEFVPVKVSDTLIVGNCYTQLKFGNDGKRYASPEAIYASLTKAYQYASQNGIDELIMPKIGSKLGGLSWTDEVEPIVNQLASDFGHIKTKVYYID